MRISAQPLIPNDIIGLAFVQTNSVTIANTDAESEIMGTGLGSKTLPPNFFTVGQHITAKIKGVMETTGNPTIRLRTYLGGNLLADSGDVSLGPTSGPVFMSVEFGYTCRTAGSSGTGIGQARFLYDTGNAEGIIGAVMTTPAALNTTVANVILITIEWGTASESNSLVSTNATIDIKPKRY